jgi:lysine 2,3-aminomutase
MIHWNEMLVSDLKTLLSLINLTDEELAAFKEVKYKWGTTRHFISLMDENDPNCPIRRQVIPSIEENIFSDKKDYLIWKENRQDKSTPDCIARQYKDRIAFLVSDVCASYCRYCFRKEAILDNSLDLKFNFEEGIHWIKEHKEIRDVLITGGDPLMLSNNKLGHIINEIRSINHVEMIRIGTRMPVVLPERIDSEFLHLIKGFYRAPIWVNIQCNHPKEVTNELTHVVYKILSCGVNVGNQSVLLKGINDDVDTFRLLNQKLLSIRVRPYYLFHCEPAPGNDHFMTTYEEGCELMDNALLGHTTGMARPMYVIATDKGKVPCRRLIE